MAVSVTGPRTVKELGGPVIPGTEIYLPESNFQIWSVIFNLWSHTTNYSPIDLNVLSATR